MSAHVLVSGTLYRAPETRTAKSGKVFTTATIKSRDGDVTDWWKMVAFSETAQAELMRLSDGDSITAQGALKAETYTAKDGEIRVSLTVIANQVLALRVPAKKRESSSGDTPPEHDHRSRQQRCAGRAGADDPSDDIPF